MSCLHLGMRHPGEEWLSNYDKAKKEAVENNRLILAFFTCSDFGAWCRKLNSEVFSKNEFKKWAVDNVILLELDFPIKKRQSEEVILQNNRLREQYQISGYPTVLFIAPDGRKIGKIILASGGSKPWIKLADKLVKKYYENK